MQFKTGPFIWSIAFMEATKSFNKSRKIHSANDAEIDKYPYKNEYINP